MEYHPWLHSLFYYGPFFTCYSAAYKFELPEGCLSDRIKQRTHRRFFYPGCSCKIPARLARSRKVEVCMMKKSIYVFLAVVLLLAVFPRHTAASEKSTYIYQTAMDVLELLGSEEGADLDAPDVKVIYGQFLICVPPVFRGQRFLCGQEGRQTSKTHPSPAGEALNCNSL